MKTGKKMLSWLCVTAMLLMMMPLSAFAATEVANGTCGDNLTWTLDDEGTLTISGKGEMWGYDNSADIPWPVEAIKKVVIEDGVTSIGMYVFFSCGNLTDASIANSVKNIGAFAFGNCSSLTEILLREGLLTIGELAFAESGLTRITIPNSVTEVGPAAFQNCKDLTEIVIPDGITEIFAGTFSGCTKLNSLTIPDTVAVIGEDAFLDCVGLGPELIIPGGVYEIAPFAFDRCDNLTDITLPKGIGIIGDHAFGYTNGYPIDGFTITGYDGVASEYAEQNGFNYVSLGVGEVNPPDTGDDNPPDIHRYDVDEDGQVSAADALLFMQAYVGLVSKLPDGRDAANVTKIDPLMAILIAVGKLPQDATSEEYYNKSPNADTVKVTVGTAESKVKVGDVVALPIYAETTIHPLVMLDIQGLIFDSNLLEFQKFTKIEVVTSETGKNYYPISVSFGTHFQLMMASEFSGKAKVGELQFKVLQDVTTEIDISVALQNVSAVTFVGTGINDALVTTEAGTVRLSPDVPEVPKVTSLLITSMPQKIVYEVGEELDDLGLIVIAVYSNGTMKNVWEGYTITGFDSAEIGTKVVTVTYEGQSATFKTLVKEHEETGMESLKAAIIKAEELIDNGLLNAGYSMSTAFELVKAFCNAMMAMVSGDEDMIRMAADNLNACVAFLESGGEYTQAGLNTVVDSIGEITEDNFIYKEPLLLFAEQCVQTMGVETSDRLEEARNQYDTIAGNAEYGNIDSSEDGVTAADALLTLQAATGKVTLNDAQKIVADVDGATGITANDALQILQYATKKITAFPIAG